MSVESSIRLQSIAQFVPPGWRVADIGSDHAYLPTYLVEQGIAPFAIAGELNAGPYQVARQRVEAAGLAQYISVRQGDGLEVLTAGEVDVVVIAGMGGMLITSILAKAQEQLVGVKRLILQPNVAAVLVRRWLYAEGWHLIAERLVEEAGKLYEILVAEPATVTATSAPLDPAYYHPQLSLEHLFLVGPHLVRSGGSLFIDKWQQEYEKRQRALASIQQAQKQEQVEQHQLQLEREAERIKEVLQCMHVERP